jgi:predicted phosphoadenosine phosphosulfate sulfurtransferase
MAEDITTLLQALSQYETQVSMKCTNIVICEVLYHSYKTFVIFRVICLPIYTVNTISDYVPKFVRNEKKNPCTLMTFTQSNKLSLLM